MLLRVIQTVTNEEIIVLFYLLFLLVETIFI